MTSPMQVPAEGARAAGYYWVATCGRRPGDEPTPPEVARWDGQYWWFIGRECEESPDYEWFSTDVLSDRIPEPAPQGDCR